MKKNIKNILIIIITISLLIINKSTLVSATESPAMCPSGKRENIITNSNCILFANCANYDRDINKIIMEIRDENQNKIGEIQKKITSNSYFVYTWYNIKKEADITLESGKVYRIDYYAKKRKGNEPKDYHNSILIATPDTNLKSDVISTSEDNAIINIEYKGNDNVVKAGIRVICDGCIVGTIEKDLSGMSNNSETTFDIKRDGQINLLPNCNYQYNTYLITKSKLGFLNEGRVDENGKFKTLENYTISKIKYKVKGKKIIIQGVLNNPQRQNIEKYGIIIKKGKKVIEKTEKVCPNLERNSLTKKMYFIRKNIGKLKRIKGKKYKYEMYAYVNGKKISKMGVIK